MKLTVDLACSKCYKKAKKALRKFPREFLSVSLNYCGLKWSKLHE